MRFASYLNFPSRGPNLGIHKQIGGTDWLLNVTQVRALYEARHNGEERANDLASAQLPPSLLKVIRRGNRALDEITDAVDFVLAEFGEELHVNRQKSVGSVEWADKVENVKFLPPISNPGKVMCQGGNYSSHLAEMDHVDRHIGIKPGDPRPFGFLKAASSLVGHNEPVVYPEGSSSLDYEAELAIVIASDCQNVPEGSARDVIFGYSCLNDMAIRDVQDEEMAIGGLVLGKNFPGGAPFGPWVVTKDEVPQDDQLRITLKVDGKVRQDETTANMSLSPSELVSYWSRMSFQPGDILSTGSPAGVGSHTENGLLRPGQVCELEIQNIGVLRTPIAE